jgi:hypothetical protein
LKEDGGYVTLPKALARKYANADRTWGWQWVFPAHRQYEDSNTGHRHTLLTHRLSPLVPFNSYFQIHIQMQKSNLQEYLLTIIGGVNPPKLSK